MTAADLTTEQREIIVRVLTKLREELLCEIPCLCTPAHTGRGLVASDCFRHDIEGVMDNWVEQFTEKEST